MFEKALQVVFGLVLVIILWQLVVVQRAATRVSDENAYLRAQVEDLRRAVRGDTWANNNTRRGAARTPLGRPGQTIDPADETFTDLPPVETSMTTPAAASDDTKAKEQEEALDRVRSEIQDLLNDVDAIEADMEAIETVMVSYQTDAQANATELAALTQEVARLSAAVERLNAGPR